MYRWLLSAHGLWRWPVIVAGVAAVGSALWAWRWRQPWHGAPALCGRLFGVAVDIQVLMGAALYLVFSPMTTIALRVNGVAATGTDMAFFGTTHALVMIAVLVAVHLSAVIVRRGYNDAARVRRSVLCYGLTLVLLLAGVPWWRPWLRLLE
jgi:hypothetical protein